MKKTTIKLAVFILMLSTHIKGQTLANPTITIKCNGEMSVSCNTGTMTTLKIVSASSSFCDPSVTQNANGTFDLKTYTEMFKMVPTTGFTSWYLGFPACKCRDQNFWQTDLNVIGSSLPSGPLGTVTIVGETGCSNSYPSLSVNNSTIYPSCGITSATLTSTVSPTGGNYLWSNSSTSPTIIVSPSITTTYTLVYSIPSTGCNSAKLSTVSVIGNMVNVNIAAMQGTVCSGQSSTLTASGATTYTWSTSAIASSIIVNPISTTVYTVTGAVGSCIGSKTISVVVNPNPTITVNASSATICAGSSSTLTAGGANSYSWSTGATVASIVVTPSITTSYTVSGSNATNLTGCINSIIFTQSVSICAEISFNTIKIIEFKIYPSPTSDHINITTNNLINTIKIYNVEGKEVLNETVGSTSAKLNIENLSSGMYFAHVTSNGITSKIKFIKQ